MEIRPVSKVEDKKIGKTIPGKITSQLMSAYEHLTPLHHSHSIVLGGLELMS